jgi:hypothetical protein
LALDCFLPDKTILIDASGWGDLLLGVVVGALKPPHPMLMERRIPTTSFQPPNFQSKKYLEDAVKIAKEIITVMRPDEETCFRIGSEYVLTNASLYLQSQGFKVQKVESTGDLKTLVEKAYIRWCIEKGVPEEILKDKKRFWKFLDWIAEKPQLRESLVKTGWASWENKWREEIMKKQPNNFAGSFSLSP